MSLYGYQRKTTPFIDEFAQHAVVFKNSWSLENLTSQSVPMILTGIDLKKKNRNEEIHFPLNVATKNVFFELSKHHYKAEIVTSSLNASPRHMGIRFPYYNAIEWVLPFWWESLFSWIHFLDIRKLGYFYIVSELHKNINRIVPIEYPLPSSKAVFEASLARLDMMDDKEPFIFYIHNVAPHHPYLPSQHFLGTFNSSHKFRTLKSQNAFFHSIDLPHYPRERESDIHILKARYDEFILTFDEAFKDFIDALQKKGIYHSSMIILTSDHGEVFQDGLLLHGNNIKIDPVFQVPLIIKLPYQSEPYHIDSKVTILDIVPTILSLLKVAIPQWMDGRNIISNELLSNFRQAHIQ